MLMIDSKKYLLQIRMIDVQINAKANELSCTHSLLFKITPTLKSVSSLGSDAKSKTDEMLTKIKDYQDRLNHLTDKYIDLREEAAEYLSLLNNPKYFDVLHKRYFEYSQVDYEYKTYEDIACEMGTSKQNVDKLHGKALLALDRIMKEVDKG